MASPSPATTATAAESVSEKSEIETERRKRVSFSRPHPAHFRVAGGPPAAVPWPSQAPKKNSKKATKTKKNSKKAKKSRWISAGNASNTSSSSSSSSQPTKNHAKKVKASSFTRACDVIEKELGEQFGGLESELCPPTTCSIAVGRYVSCSASRHQQVDRLLSFDPTLPSLLYL